MKIKSWTQKTQKLAITQASVERLSRPRRPVEKAAPGESFHGNKEEGFSRTSAAKTLVYAVQDAALGTAAFGFRTVTRCSRRESLCSANEFSGGAHRAVGVSTFWGPKKLGVFNLKKLDQTPLHHLSRSPTKRNRVRVGWAANPQKQNEGNSANEETDGCVP